MQNNTLRLMDFLIQNSLKLFYLYYFNEVRVPRVNPPLQSKEWKPLITIILQENKKKLKKKLGATKNNICACSLAERTRKTELSWCGKMISDSLITVVEHSFCALHQTFARRRICTQAHTHSYTHCGCTRAYVKMKLCTSTACWIYALKQYIVSFQPEKCSSFDMICMHGHIINLSWECASSEKSFYHVGYNI